MSSTSRSDRAKREGGYDPAKDAHDSYFAAVEAKRRRGDDYWLKPIWKIVTPAPPSAALEVGARFARIRRGILAQVRNAETAAIYRGDQVLAVAMFTRHGWRRLEMALAIAPAAAAHMRRLVRIAQLTLARMTQDRIVVVAIRPENFAGRRMAMLTGFRRARTRTPKLWVFRGDHHGNIQRRPGQETGRAGKAHAADRVRPPAGRAAPPGKPLRRVKAKPARKAAVHGKRGRKADA